MVNTWLTKSISASLLTLLTIACQPESSTPPSSENSAPSINPSGTIVVADISDEPTKKIERFQPFADYLATQLHDINIGVGEVEIAPDLETMADWLTSGKVDLYFDSPYPAMRVSEIAGAQPILRRWKKGFETYHTIIFTRIDSDVKTLEDLKGKMVAFDEPSSTSGYMLPLGHLINAGFQLIEKQSITARVPTDQMGYIFSEDDDNSIQWVLTERVAAAAVGSSDFLKIPEETRQELVILAETESIPRNLVVVSPTLTAEEVAKIKATLLAMNETEDGLIALETFEKTTQFDEFPEGIDQAINRMRTLYELTQK